MDKLLQWLVAQQLGDKEAMARIGQPDPKMLEQLFGGPDEPALMKQAMMVVSSSETSLENKLVAFDNFAMLVENMDNANNIENLGLWPAVIAQLAPEADVELRVNAASAVAVAVQNNPKAQKDFLGHPEGLERILAIAGDTETSQELRLKGLGALSSLLRHCPEAYARFDEQNGWKVLESNQKGNDRTKMRVLSVMSAVLSTGLDDTKNAHIQSSGLVQFVVSVMQKDGHTGCIDRSLSIITQLAQLKYQFSATEISDLVQGLERVEELREHLTEDDLNAAKQVVSR